MLRKRTLSVLLILVLALSNISIAYGMESTWTAEDSTTGDGIEDGQIEDEGNPVTEDAIQEGPQLPTQSGVEEDDTARSVKTTYKYYVKNINSAGTTVNVKTVSGTSKSTVISSANTYMNNIYKGTATDADTSRTYKNSLGLVVMDSSNKVINMVRGIAYFKSSAATANIGDTYITPKDVMHFFSGTGTNATVGISGAKASVAVSKLTLVPETLVNNNFYRRNYYTKLSSGDMVHYVYKVVSPNTSSPYKSGTGKTGSYSVHTVDKGPSWMKQGTKYYSADGVNFYTNTALSTKAGTYYAYYQYLPYRTMSAYTATNLNTWINYRTKSVSPTNKTSKLKNQGRNLVNFQNRYGVNAVNELAFACLESAYGKSSFALSRNNLFGLNAVDSNPGKATYFSSAGNCIKQHTNLYMSRKYGDAKGDFRYFGLAPGNKGVGVNVKYASDPWHGEKISGIAYSIDKYLGSKDYRKFTVGVTKTKSTQVYKNAGSTPLYKLSTYNKSNGLTGVPVVILGSSGSYYRVQSDMPISGNDAKFSYSYYFSKSTAYVKKSDITVVNNGSRTYTTQISKNNLLRNITLKVGKKNYFKGFNPSKTSYTIKVPKKTKTITINGTRLMTTSKVTGNGKKNLNKKTKTYKIKVKPKSGSTKTYTIKVVPK